MPTPKLPMSLRIPEDLREQLRKEAVENDRSLTAEIINRLRRSLTQQETTHV